LKKKMSKKSPSSSSSSSSSSSGPTPREKVLAYLAEHNRPFTVAGLLLVPSLKDEVSKGALTKILDDEATKGRVVKKMISKSAVYWQQQAGLPVGSPAELRGLEDRAKQLQQEIRAMQSELQALNSSNQALASTPTTAEADQAIAETEAQVAQMSQKLEALSEGKQLLPEAERKRIEKRFETSRAEWRRRKRIATDIISQLRESTGLSIKDFKETPGIETDSDCDISIERSEIDKRRRTNKTSSSTRRIR
jgi:vacuolar-type H+-ATPase subunit I/STV1